jgi:hypothetical protein
MRLQGGVVGPIALGALWFSRSMQSYGNPHFTHPSTPADWSAVASFSLALVLVPVGLHVLLGLAEGVGTRTRILSAASGVAAVAAGVGRFLDDGIGVDAGGIVYVIGMMAFMLGLLGLGTTLALHTPRWPGVVLFATFAGVVGLDSGGGILILGAWLTVAIMRIETWRFGAPWAFHLPVWLRMHRNDAVIKS